MEMQQKQNIANLAVIARNVETASQRTHSEVRSIATPVHSMNSRFGLVLQKEEDIKTTLSNIQLQVGQNHDITLDICHNISEQYHQILRRDRAFPRSLQNNLCTALVEFGAEQQLLKREFEISGQKREDEAEEMRARMKALVCVVRF